jgi:hypothetical protein
MDTDLNSLELLPFSQPYNAAPWNYEGTESVSSIPNADVVDWILIELHDTTDAALVSDETMIGRQAAFLLINGSVVDVNENALDFGSLNIQNSLFVKVYHRNHIRMLSANPLTKTGGVYIYNFTTSIDQAYQSGQKDISGIAVMIGGDINADSDVNENDLYLWKNAAGTAGYLGEDVNMDGQVNNPDKNGDTVLGSSKIN